MSKRSISKYNRYANEMITWLVDNPDSTYRQIQQHLDDYAATLARPPVRVPEARAIIHYVRGELGPETIVCTRSRRSATYQIAASRIEALTWINDRKKNIRTQIQRTHKAVEDIETKFGSDRDLRMVRVSLESALLILDASIVGGVTAR